MAIAESQLAIRNSHVLIASSNEEFRRQCVDDPQFDASDIEEAAGGADALAKLESQEWSEVLLDRRLHDLDVSEVISMIRSRHPHLLVRLVDSDLPIERLQDRSSLANETPVATIDAPAGNLTEARNAPFEEEIGVVEERGMERAHPRIEPLPGMMGVGPGLEHIFKLARLGGP